MRKLSTANPLLTYPERKAMLAQLVPVDLGTDNAVATHLERSQAEIEQYVSSVRNAHRSDNITSWASSDRDVVLDAFQRIASTLSEEEKEHLRSMLATPSA